MPLILIVEDSDSVTALEIALTGLAGIETLLARNGRDALNVLDRERDVVAVVTDLHLPALDGFGLITAIRAHARYGKLPIIVVSGDNHPGNSFRARELGANAFFAKPYSPAQIRHAVEELLHAP